MGIENICLHHISRILALPLGTVLRNKVLATNQAAFLRPLSTYLRAP